MYSIDLKERVIKYQESPDTFCWEILLISPVLIRPIPYSIFDEEDYCYWIDIPFSKNLKFKLTDTNEIIKEYRRIAYPEPQN